MSPESERTKGVVIRIFSYIISFVCVVSFVTMLTFKLTKPEADGTVFLHIFLMSFGYLVGILTGLLGLSGKD